MIRYGLLALAGLLLVGCQHAAHKAPVQERYWVASRAKPALHRVIRGETLYAIAFRYDTDYRKLARLNHLNPPYALSVGQAIYLVIPRRHRHTLIHQRPFLTAHRLPRPKRSLRPRILNPKTGRWQWPARGRIVTAFIPGEGKKGIDIAGRKGEKVFAAAAGVVAYAGKGLTGYGNLIIVKHPGNYLTAYGHNVRNLVIEGQLVKAGQAIAEMGWMDNRFFGVHFEIRRSGQPVNPQAYLNSG